MGVAGNAATAGDLILAGTSIKDLFNSHLGQNGDHAVITAGADTIALDGFGATTLAADDVPF